MAPKKPPSVKSSTVKSTLADKIKAFIRSPMALYLAVMVSVIIFSVAVLFIVYAVREWEKTAHLRHAMVMIKEFMVARDANFKGKEDPEIVLETDKVAKELASWAIMLNEIEAELDNIRFRLNHDWVAYRNAIYLLQDYGNPWDVLKELCKKEKADMVKVESEEEEAEALGNVYYPTPPWTERSHRDSFLFLEKQLQGRHSPYWLGLRKETDKWRWDVDGTELTRAWDPKQVQPSDEIETLSTNYPSKLLIDKNPEVLGNRGANIRDRYCIKIQSTLCDDSDKLQRHQAEVLGGCSLQ